MKTAAPFFFRCLLAVVMICTLPVLARAEFLIGVVMTGDVPYYRAMHEAFVEALDTSVSAGENVQIILQKPFPDPISLSNAARKLIAYDVNLIVTYGSPATHAVLNEKSKIPVVYAGVYDPEKAALQGKRITGCGFKVPLSSLLRYMKRLKQIDTLRIIYSSVEEDSSRQAEEMLVLAEQQGVLAKKIDIRSRKDLAHLETIGANDAVFITGSSTAHLWLENIMSFVHRQKVPTATIFPDSEEVGVLITLFQPPHEQGEKAAEMALQVLKVEPPGNIQPDVLRGTELVFNLREAQQVGLKFPIQLIIEATRVIK